MSLWRRGARVIVGCANPVLLKRLPKPPEEHHPTLEVVPLDLTSKAKIDSFVRHVTTSGDRVDVLIANAGIIDRSDHQLVKMKTR